MNDDTVNNILDTDICGDDWVSTCDKCGDAWTDITFPSIPSILDTDDLKVNGLMCPTLGVYQFLYIGIFFAMFYTNFVNESAVLYLAPYTDQKKSKYCQETPISITSSYWIDENGYFEGDVNYDSSHTLYRIDMKNMKLSLDEYQSMIDYFENEYKILASRTEQRDATFSLIAYTSFNMRYFPKAGGRVDFYLSGDSSVAFDSIYEGTNTFFASNNDVCVPNNIEINYDKAKSTIVTDFETYHSMPYDEGTPTIAPTITIPSFKLDYFSDLYKADFVDITLCNQGQYTIGDCDCTGDQFLYLYDSNEDLVSSSDDNCGPLNLCSQINYQYLFSDDDNPSPQCSNFKLLMSTFSGDEVKGKMTLAGPGLTSSSYKVEDSYIYCQSDESHACILTCPNSNQDIVDISYAYYAVGSFVIPNSDSWCDDSVASASLYNDATTNCINQNTCSITIDPNSITTSCSDDDYYYYDDDNYVQKVVIQALCQKVRRRQLDQDYDYRHDLHRRLGSSSDVTKQKILIQTCQNDVTKEFVLDIGSGSSGAGDLGFHDTGEKASSSIDMRSVATVIAVNSNLVSVNLLTKTASFGELIDKLIFTEYDSQSQLNFEKLKQMDMAFYDDEFYEGMEPILCGKFTVNDRKVELCSLVVSGTVAIPVLTSEGLTDKSSYDEVDLDLQKKRCLFQLQRLRCDRFSFSDCELDYVEQYDFNGEGFNHYYFGLIYISNNDLSNKGEFGQYVEWVDILLRFMKNDIDNYDDNFQSAAYNIMATYRYVQIFDTLKTNDGHYDHLSHSRALNTTFYSYFNSSSYNAYPSHHCPAHYRTLLHNGFKELCGDVVCKMMVVPYRNQDDAFSSFLGNYVGVGTNRFKAGDKSTYGSQMYREGPFKKVRESPPSQLVSEVLTCRQNPTNVFVNSIGITYSNSQLLLGIVFSGFAAILIRIWNRRQNSPKLYSVTKKDYLYKQTLAAAFNCIDDRMKILEEKLIDNNNNNEYASLYHDILDVIDLVDQVDDIDPHLLVKLIKSMKISPPITAIKRQKEEVREKRRSIKLSKSGKFMSVAPLPPDIQHSINRDNDNNDNNNDINHQHQHQHHHHHHHNIPNEP